MTETLKRRRPFGSLEALIIRMRWEYLDQAIAIHWLLFALSSSPLLPVYLLQTQLVTVHP